MDGSLLALERRHNKHGIMHEEQDEEDLGSMSSFSDDDDDNDDSSGLSTPASSDDGLKDHEGHLYDMSNLMAQLPFKRGQSKFYEGKSRSFTSLASVQILEDLPKPDVNCKNKKQKQMETCKSYGGSVCRQKHCSTNVHTNIYSRTITKSKMRPSRTGNVMCSSKSKLLPPLPPQRASRRGVSPSRTLLLA